MGQRKQPSSTLTEAQREAAAKALREAAKAIYVTAADAYILTDIVGDLAVTLVRLAGRLPREWGETASDRVGRGLRSGGATSTLGLLHTQASLAGAVRMDAGDRIDKAAGRRGWPHSPCSPRSLLPLQRTDANWKSTRGLNWPPRCATSKTAKNDGAHLEHVGRRSGWL